METLSWPPNYVARCPVVMFEAAQGSISWQPSATIGELHMRPLENELLQFQLCDLLDGQMLFEHTLCKPDAFSMLTQRFFVIRHENGSHKGFGFSNATAAREMNERIEKALDQLIANSSLPLRRRNLQVHTAQGVPGQASMVPPVKKHRRRIRINGLRALIHFFDKSDIEIGYPTDVKHVAHIGWDGHSINGPSLMDNLRAAPDFSTGPLRNFGQPGNPTWLLDALFSAKWTLSNACEVPPQPPQQFMDGPIGVKSSRRKIRLCKKKR